VTGIDGGLQHHASSSLDRKLLSNRQKLRPHRGDNRSSSMANGERPAVVKAVNPLLELFAAWFSVAETLKLASVPPVVPSTKTPLALFVRLELLTNTLAPALGWMPIADTVKPKMSQFSIRLQRGLGT
jgi:hypothetical protein